MTEYMVIERFHDGKLKDIYQRFSEKGRMLPEGLYYIDSWLSQDANICFQLMKTNEYHLFDEWTEKWSDLTEFDIYPINHKPK